MRGVVRAVRNGSPGDEGEGVGVADLRYRYAFHFDAQRMRQSGAQGLHLGGAGDKAVATGNQALVNAG